MLPSSYLSVNSNIGFPFLSAYREFTTLAQLHFPCNPHKHIQGYLVSKELLFYFFKKALKSKTHEKELLLL